MSGRSVHTLGDRLWQNGTDVITAEREQKPAQTRERSRKPAEARAESRTQSRAETKSVSKRDANRGKTTNNYSLKLDRVRRSFSLSVSHSETAQRLPRSCTLASLFPRTWAMEFFRKTYAELSAEEETWEHTTPSKIENMWGASPPHSPSKLTLYRGPAIPRPPAIYPSNLQNPQARLQCLSNANFY